MWSTTISENIQASHNCLIFLFVCSKNNAADATGFKQLPLKIADDFCAYRTGHSGSVILLDQYEYIQNNNTPGLNIGRRRLIGPLACESNIQLLLIV
jgi:hypothetical protein